MLTWTLLNDTGSGNKTFELRLLQDVTGPAGGATEQEVCQIESVQGDRSSFFGMYGQDCVYEASAADYTGYKTLMHEVMPPVSSDGGTIQ